MACGETFPEKLRCAWMLPGARQSHGLTIGGCESLTPLSLINYLNQWCDRVNSLYLKLWTHLDNREKRDLRSTNVFTID